MILMLAPFTGNAAIFYFLFSAKFLQGFFDAHNRAA